MVVVEIRIRYTTPFISIGAIFFVIATVLAFVGHCNNSDKTLLAAGLYVFGDLLVGSGVLTFASAISDSRIVLPRRTSIPIEILYADFGGGPYEYLYGWCFFATIAALILSVTAALLFVLAYLRRFPTMEVMARHIIPGVDRKLRERELMTSSLLAYEHHQVNSRPQTIQPNNFTGSGENIYNRMEYSTAAEVEGAEGPSMPSNWGPDIYTSDQFCTFQGDVQVNAYGYTNETLDLPGCSFDPIPGTSSQNTGMRYQNDYDADLAGVTIPISILRKQPRMSENVLGFETDNTDEQFDTPYPFPQRLSRFDNVDSSSAACFQQKTHADVGCGTSLSSYGGPGVTDRFCTIQPIRKKCVQFNTFEKQFYEPSNNDTDEWENSEV